MIIWVVSITPPRKSRNGNESLGTEAADNFQRKGPGQGNAMLDVDCIKTQSIYTSSQSILVI